MLPCHDNNGKSNVISSVNYLGIPRIWNLLRFVPFLFDSKMIKWCKKDKLESSYVLLFIINQVERGQADAEKN